MCLKNTKTNQTTTKKPNNNNLVLCHFCFENSTLSVNKKSSFFLFFNNCMCYVCGVDGDACRSEQSGQHLLHERHHSVSAGRARTQGVFEKVCQGFVTALSAEWMKMTGILYDSHTGKKKKILKHTLLYILDEVYRVTEGFAQFKHIYEHTSNILNDRNANGDTCTH